MTYKSGWTHKKLYQEGYHWECTKNWLICVAIAGVIFLVAGCQKEAKAEDISDKEAVQCLLGEARGEGFNAMVAHAEAIRNRGHLRGVYGCKADFKKEMPYLTSKWGGYLSEEGKVNAVCLWPIN